MQFLKLGIAITALTVSACSASKTTKPVTDNGIIDIQFVQVNDVYEIAPIEAGKVGGVARVASIKKELKAKNPNTYLLMAGDFLSPSVYNSLMYEGKRIRGRQMVESLNAAGLDIAGFGNHEFDISEAELQSRINESRFDWISSNSFHKTTTAVVPFEKITPSGKAPLPLYQIRTFADADGTAVKIGFMGINIPFNKATYVQYTDPLEAAEKIYNAIRDSCDAVIAITHQLEEDDIILAKRLPGLALIVGGHEHDMRYDKVGSVIVSKAHANARSAYILKLRINKKTGRHKVDARLQMIDQSVAIDAATNLVVQKWMDIAEKNYASIGFDAKNVVLASGEPLDAREASVRSIKTNFTRLLVNAIDKAAPDAAVAIVNSGSIRLDDFLAPPVTQFDIIRSLPFGGSIQEVDMKGSLLKQVLDAGKKNIGIGGFLHYSEKLGYDAVTMQWQLNGSSIPNDQVYRVALTDFLLTGGEANLGFLTKTNPDILRVYPVITDMNDPRFDIRSAIIKYLQQRD
ncbi:MAG: bifunctional metallophosphatase/5'-nucleotidase [Chitinophagaceae bacterium]|nr:MAG: bifunctional metallophosphatase/5'-nucleotidase [Chitinophagaceae bacterium]